MLEKAYHWLSGYVEFQVEGDGARFFTVAAKRGAAFWGFARAESKAVARVKPRSYRALRPLCKRCGVRLRVRRRGGLPFQLRRLRKRPGLLAGAALAAGLFWFLSGFVWGVEFTGCEKVPVNQLAQCAREQGVYLGAKKGELAPRSAANRILNEMPQLSWVSVNTGGCFVQVAVKEGAAKPEPEKSQELSNMVAVREGEVVHIEAQQGRPEVKLGDVVVKGQLLIAGLYQEVPDPYGPQPDRLYQVAGAARGKVLAKTYREFTVQVEDSVQETQEAGREVRLWAEVFGLRLPLGLWSRTEGETQSWREERRASLLGVELPLALEWETLVRLERRERKLTKEQMKTAALLKLREAQRTALGEGGSVLHEELSFTFAEGRCMVSARCRCQENIGEIQVISTN